MRSRAHDQAYGTASSENIFDIEIIFWQGDSSQDCVKTKTQEESHHLAGS